MIDNEKYLLLWADARMRVAGWLLLVAMVALGYGLSAPSSTLESGVKDAPRCGNPSMTDPIAQKRMSILFGRPVDLRQGEKVFKDNCASCHRPDKDMTGPALKGVLDRAPQPSLRWVHAFLSNCDSLIRRKDPYVLRLRAQWSHSMEWRHRNGLTPQEVDDVVAWIEAYR